MTHTLVRQLHFARQELGRCLQGVDEAEAQTRLGPMNSLSWIVGHLADQENHYWVRLAQGKKIHPEVREQCGYGRPPSTPQLDDMWAAWREITLAADGYLGRLRDADLDGWLRPPKNPEVEPVGVMLLRVINHYWFHIGEAYAIREQLGHTQLPEFVGDMPTDLHRSGNGAEPAGQQGSDHSN